MSAPRIAPSPILTPKLKRVIGGTDGRFVGENEGGEEGMTDGVAVETTM
jgi:hypothetical protein